VWVARLLFVVLLETVAGLAGWVGASWRVVASAVVWGLLAPFFGMVQLQILPGDLHWAGWPAIFLINVPVGIVGFLGLLRVPARPSDIGDRTVPFDPVGLGLLALGLTFALYGASEAPVVGWTSEAVWPFWATGVPLIGAYIIWSLRRPHPAMDLRSLWQRQTALAVGLSSLASVVMFAILFLIPVFWKPFNNSHPCKQHWCCCRRDWSPDSEQC